MPHSLVVFHQEYAQPPGAGGPPSDQVWYAAGGRVNSRWRCRTMQSRRKPVLNLYSSSGAAPDRDHTVAEQGRENGRDLSEDVLRLVVEGLTDHAVRHAGSSGGHHLLERQAPSTCSGGRSEQAVRVHVSSLLGPGGRDAGIGTTDLEEAKRQGSVTVTTAVEPSGRKHQRRQNDHSRASERRRVCSGTAWRRIC